MKFENLKIANTIFLGETLVLDNNNGLTTVARLANVNGKGIILLNSDLTVGTVSNEIYKALVGSYEVIWCYNIYQRTKQEVYKNLSYELGLFYNLNSNYNSKDNFNKILRIYNIDLNELLNSFSLIDKFNYFKQINQF